MSTASKVVLILLGLGGVMIVLCCGGMFLVGWFGYRTAQNVAKSVVVGNPAKAQAVAQTFIDIDVPEGFVATSAFDFGAMVSQDNGKMVSWQRESDGAMLIIMLTPVANAAPPVMVNPGTTGTSTKVYNVMGQGVAFQFSNTTEDAVPGQVTSLTITGTWSMQAGRVTLTLTLPDGQFDEEAFVAMLDSISEPAAPEEPVTSGDEPIALPQPADGSAVPDDRPADPEDKSRGD